MIVECSVGDYTYILIGLVWVAYSIYKGSQKNKKAQSTEQEKVNNKPAMEDIIGEFLGYKQQETVYKEENLEQNPQENLQVDTLNVNPLTQEESSEVFSFDDEYEEEGNFFEEKKVYTTEVEDKFKESETVKQKPVRKIRKPRIDIRKAVIYAEILKRPSY